MRISLYGELWKINILILILILTVYYGKKHLNINVLWKGTLEYQCIMERNTGISVCYKKEHVNIIVSQGGTHVCFYGVPSPK